MKSGEVTDIEMHLPSNGIRLLDLAQRFARPKNELLGFVLLNSCHRTDG